MANSSSLSTLLRMHLPPDSDTYHRTLPTLQVMPLGLLLTQPTHQLGPQQLQEAQPQLKQQPLQQPSMQPPKKFNHPTSTSHSKAQEPLWSSPPSYQSAAAITSLPKE